MRSLEQARDSWAELKLYDSIPALKSAVRLDGRSSVCNDGLRSACWKTFLLFDSIETSSWPRTLTSSRSAYDSLRMHFLQHLDFPDESIDSGDPLSEERESLSPAANKDAELRAEIQQDVDRCMPENLYFRQPDTQRVLLDILFVYCKLNPDVSYRQGMHELLAPILWVVERDAINLGQSSKAMGEDAVIRTVFDADFVEHDTFALYSQLMQGAKGFYEQTTHTATENPIVLRSKRIVADLLSQVDPGLAHHLDKLDVAPQIFLMRWIRLLFGREFAFDDTLTIWDVIFAEDPSLEIVDHLCVVMLLRIHWELLEADYNETLSILLRYPSPDRDFVPQSLALDALYLRDHMNIDGGSYLVLKYSGRPLQPINRPVTPPALQRNITAFSGVNAAKAALRRMDNSSPTQRPRPPRNLEAILQSTAKHLYTRGEQFGIGKAVRNAMDEVHRKAQEIRDTQTPSPPVSWRRSSRPMHTLVTKVEELEQRDRNLGKLLDGAVAELWECQKLIADAKDSPGSSAVESEKAEAGLDLERLSVAIARVQFVQVYLQDASLPLPEESGGQRDDTSSVEAAETAIDEKAAASDETPASHTPYKPAITASAPATSQAGLVQGLADPSAFEEVPDPQTKAESTAESVVQSDPPVSETASLEKDLPTAATRPTLAESPYSFMLGQSKDGEAPKAASRLTEEQPRRRGFLFGDGKGGAAEEDVAAVAPSGSSPRASGRHKKKSSIAKAVSSEEILDIEAVQSGRRPQGDGT